MARIMEGECSASQCSLIYNDYWDAVYGRIMVVSRVRLAYDSKAFDIICPERRNLTPSPGTNVLEASQMTLGLTPRMDHGLAHTIGSSQLKRRAPPILRT